VALIEADGPCARSGLPVEIAQAQVIRAGAELVLDRLDRAEAALVEARAIAFGIADSCLEAEIHFVSAMAASKDTRFALARESLATILGLPEGGDGVFALGFWRGRALELISKLDLVEHGIASSSKTLIRAFGEFERAHVRDLFIEASMLLNVSIRARDGGQRDLIDFVTIRAANFAWNPHVAFFESSVFHAIGRRCSFEGDHIGALRSFRRSAESAPSKALRLLALLDRCELIRELGETLSAADELDYAVRLASEIDWNAASGFDREALRSLARLLAPVDAVRARALFGRYTASAAVAWTVVGTLEAKVTRANACCVEAQILKAEGERKRAITLLLEAHRIWTAARNDREIASTAIELAELTGEERYRTIAMAAAATFPKSILARRLRDVKALTP